MNSCASNRGNTNSCYEELPDGACQTRLSRFPQTMTISPQLIESPAVGSQKTVFGAHLIGSRCAENDLIADIERNGTQTNGFSLKSVMGSDTVCADYKIHPYSVRPDILQNESIWVPKEDEPLNTQQSFVERRCNLNNSLMPHIIRKSDSSKTDRIRSSLTSSKSYHTSLNGSTPSSETLLFDNGQTVLSQSPKSVNKSVEEAVRNLTDTSGKSNRISPEFIDRELPFDVPTNFPPPPICKKVPSFLSRTAFKLTKRSCHVVSSKRNFLSKSKGNKYSRDIPLTSTSDIQKLSSIENSGGEMPLKSALKQKRSIPSHCTPLNGSQLLKSEYYNNFKPAAASEFSTASFSQGFDVRKLNDNFPDQKPHQYKLSEVGFKCCSPIQRETSVGELEEKDGGHNPDRRYKRKSAPSYDNGNTNLTQTAGNYSPLPLDAPNMFLDSDSPQLVLSPTPIIQSLSTTITLSPVHEGAKYFREPIAFDMPRNTNSSPDKWKSVGSPNFTIISQLPGCDSSSQLSPQRENSSCDISNIPLLTPPKTFACDESPVSDDCSSNSLSNDDSSLPESVNLHPVTSVFENSRQGKTHKVTVSESAVSCSGRSNGNRTVAPVVSRPHNFSSAVATVLQCKLPEVPQFRSVLNNASTTGFINLSTEELRSDQNNASITCLSPIEIINLSTEELRSDQNNASTTYLSPIEIINLSTVEHRSGQNNTVTDDFRGDPKPSSSNVFFDAFNHLLKTNFRNVPNNTLTPADIKRRNYFTDSLLYYDKSPVTDCNCIISGRLPRSSPLSIQTCKMHRPSLVHFWDTFSYDSLDSPDFEFVDESVILAYFIRTMAGRCSRNCKCAMTLVNRNDDTETIVNKVLFANPLYCYKHKNIYDVNVWKAKCRKTKM